MAATYCNIGFKIYILTSKIDRVYDFANKMNSDIFKPKDEDERM